MAEFDAYCAAVNEAKLKWKGRLDILLGLEADYIEGVVSPKDWKNKGLDYIIGSVHFVRGAKTGGLVPVDANAKKFSALIEDEFAGDALAAVRAYYDALMKMADEGGFDILGHFDLVKKNNVDNRFFDFSGPDYSTIAAAAARFIKQAQNTHGFVIEVNCGAIARGTYPDTYPSAVLIKELKGVPFVVTSDAHRPEHLGVGYDVAAANLREAG
jgi:histidinol-phosphatase (PHP family)